MSRAEAGAAALIDGIPQAAAEQAVQWMIELRDAPQGDAALHQSWRAWRAADPDHERAWRRIEHVNASLAPLQALESGIARTALAAPASVRRRRAIKALTLALFGTGAGAALLESTPWQIYRADYRTALGERRDVTLADGTRVTLNTDSAFDIAYGASERRLRLLAGEVLIVTAHASGRPFTVETRDGRAQALGTRFLVRQYDDAMLVAVYEGAVRVWPSHAPREARLLEAGQQVRCSARHLLEQGAADEAGLSWTDGTILADSMPLGDLISELARYTGIELQCAPEVAALRVSGSYPVDDPHAVLGALAGMLNLEVQTVQRFWGAAGLRMAPRART